MSKARVISHVRMQSAAGWYLGSIEVASEDAQPYDRDSMYYPSEEHVRSEYPASISLKEAFYKGGVK
ncbi:hypothetical protein P4571_08320 [Niallia alba]|uniref:hypothetical protein n=1 Tax=Niallia alba TaxID=2729105 RepID=UPI002E1C621F|nr:hypothetical protein [Niallia alba]